MHGLTRCHAPRRFPRGEWAQQELLRLWGSCCQDPQVPSSPISLSPGGSGCKLAPTPSVTPFCVTHGPEMRSATENCHNKYAVNLRGLSPVISPEAEGREAACRNVPLFCYMMGLCNFSLSKPSEGGWLRWSLSARQRSQTASTPSRALAGFCGSRGRFTQPAPGMWQGHITCPC